MGKLLIFYSRVKLIIHFLFFKTIKNIFIFILSKTLLRFICNDYPTKKKLEKIKPDSKQSDFFL